MKPRHVAQLMTRYYRYMWWLLCLLFSIPMLTLAQRWNAGSLGPNPLEILTKITGHSALLLLLLSMTLTPLRRVLAFFSRNRHSIYGKRLSDWNTLIRLRRMIGLWSFFYAAAHLWIWMEFDIGWDWSEMIRTVGEKPYITAGMACMTILSLLAATSTNAAIRALRKNWKRLHRLVYIAAIAVALHYLWLSKIGHHFLPLIYAAFISLLLGYRVLSKFGVLLPLARDDGEEVPERSSSAS